MKAVNHFVRSVLALVLLCCFSIANAEVITENRTIEVDDLSLENLDVVVDGATLTINGAHSFNSLELKNGATLTHSVEAVEKLDITVSGLVSIDQSSLINVNSRGQGKPSGHHGYVGGSYGGRGGFYDIYESVEEYGSYTSPVDYGTGGQAGRGGGAIKLTAGELVLEGTIQADGTISTGHGGAASGGSIWLRAGTLSGTGGITANGGDARSGYYGSGGGGGRVAVYFEQNEGFDLNNVKALGGLGGYRSQSAAAGTVYFVDERSQSKQLRLLGQTRAGRTTVIQGKPEDLSDLLVKNAQAEFHSEDIAPGGVVTVDNGQLYLRGAHTFGSLSLVNNGILSHPFEVEKKLSVTVTGRASVDETSSIDLNIRGHAKPSGQQGYVGGSYGGRGGFYDIYESVEEYGSYTSPVDYGTGGQAGRGGGAIKLTAGELVLEGTIQADGTSSTGHGGAASGGSIWLRAGTLSGTGGASLPMVEARGRDTTAVAAAAAVLQFST